MQYVGDWDTVQLQRLECQGYLPGPNWDMVRTPSALQSQHCPPHNQEFTRQHRLTALMPVESYELLG